VLRRTAVLLVTGGSGFVGSHLLPQLVEAGYQVRCLVRLPGEAKLVEAMGAAAVTGDVADPDSLKVAFNGVESVVHLVAVLREGRGATFNRVNVEGTGNVVTAAREASVKRFIHIGAMGASDMPRYAYFHSKWQGEEIVRVSTLDFTIFKPGAMFGKGAGFIDKLVKSVNMFPFLAPIAGSGRTRFQPLWVEDLATCILAALEGDKIGQTCEIGGPEHLTYEQILNAVVAIMGKKRLKIHIPVMLMRPTIGLMERILGDPPVTGVELKALEMDNIGVLDSVENQFGFKPLELAKGLGYLKKA
jgi:NADH dehydrogenase